MTSLRILSKHLTHFSAISKHKSNVFDKTARHYSKSNQLKVTLCGAAGNIGQPLSLLLKQCNMIDELALYDIKGASGLAAELMHIDTACKVTSYNHTLHAEAFKDASLVVIAASSPRSSIKEDYYAPFEANAYIVKELIEYGSIYSPQALYAIATTPIESLVPLAFEIFKLKGICVAKTLMGVTEIDIVRANTFVADLLGIEPEYVTVPVIGGNSKDTIVPCYSLAKPCNDFTPEETEKLTTSSRMARRNILRMKGNEAATLSTAFGIARFVISLLKGIKGQTVFEHAFIRTDAHPNVHFLSVPLQIGQGGIQRDLGIPNISDYERCLLDRAIPHLQREYERAKNFLGIKDVEPCDPCSDDPKEPLCPEDYCEKLKKSSLCDTPTGKVQ